MRLKIRIEGPEPAPDRLIRSIRDNRGIVSRKLRAEYARRDKPETARDTVRAIREEIPWTGADED